MALNTPDTEWSGDPAELAAGLAVDPAVGLGQGAAAARLQQVGPNRLRRYKPIPRWRKLLHHFADPLVYLLVGAVVVSIVVWAIEGAEGLPLEALVIAVIVVANGILGYAQTSRAEQAVAALQKLTETTCLVLRDGEPTRIAASDVVPGDVVMLAEGDAIPADGRLIESASLRVIEATLTGESEPVAKAPGVVDRNAPLAERNNMVFGGTSVVAGRGTMLITSTGMGTEMGTIARLLDETPEQPAPLQLEVGRIGRMLGLAVVVICVVVVGAIWVTSEIRTASDVVAVLLVGVSLAVAAVPEGLPVILTVVLALGVQRMARRNAIARRLSAVETLGSVSVICSDKTGTLTRSEMTIERVVTGSGETAVTGAGYLPEGEFLVDGTPLDDPVLVDEVGRVLRGGSLASDARLVEESGVWGVEGDPTEGAFLVAESKLGATGERLERFTREDEIPFTSERKMMTTLVVDSDRDDLLNAVTKGAPDAVLAISTFERVAGEVIPLDEKRRGEILEDVDRLADDALRVLAVAYRTLPDHKPEAEVETDLVFLGLVGIIDAPRPEARQAVAEAATAGVRVVMITGDHPRTALRVAVDLGIATRDSRVLSGPEIAETDPPDLVRLLDEISVCARVAPEHKLKIVDALQDGGHIVAMTGDGVNDAPALKSADIGIAMGVTGTDVTKEAADMVLADDNFATIVAAIREGRSILANIRNTLRFLLSSNIGEVLTMFFGVIGATVIGLDGQAGAVMVPLLAAQILWINLLTDTGPALAMGFDGPPPGVMRRPPRRSDERIMDRDMWTGVLWVGALMAVVTLLALDLRLPGGLIDGSGDIDQARTMAFTTLVLAQLFNCLNARSDRESAFRRMFNNRLLWLAIAVSTLLQIVVVHLPFLNRAFGTAPLTAGDWLMCVGLASVVLWVVELRKFVARRNSAAENPPYMALSTLGTR